MAERNVPSSIWVRPSKSSSCGLEFPRFSGHLPGRRRESEMASRVRQAAVMAMKKVSSSVLVRRSTSSSPGRGKVGAVSRT